MCSRQLIPFILCAFLGIAQSQSPNPKNFAGTWQATFKGTIFCTLKIESASDPSGTLSPGKVTVDDDGEITEAEPSSPDAAYPILNPKIDGNTLAFEWKETGDIEVLKFEFKLTGIDQAELSLINEDHIKPIHLQRAP